MPEVSIIMPAYNSAAFIGEALESVLDQDFEDYEIIVVDDGSTDQTAQIISHFNDPRIRYVYQENEGPSSARNRGLRLAKGDLIAFLDADDLWEANYLSHTVGYLYEHPKADGVYCGYRYMQEDGTPLPEIVNRIVPPERLYSRLLEGNFLSTCSVIIRRGCLDQIGYFDVNLQHAEDYDIWLRLARTYNIMGLTDTLVWYRRHRANTTLDVHLQNQSLKAIVEKHFGEDDSKLESWSPEKRLAYAGYYCIRAGNLLRVGDIEGCTRSIGRMLLIRPDWVGSERWYFMLASASRPRHRMGEVEALDLETSEILAFEVFNNLFTVPEFSSLQCFKPQIEGLMYWTLGTLAYWQREIRQSRFWYQKVTRTYPPILLDYSRSYFLVKFTIAGLLRQLWKQTKIFSNRP